MKIVSPDVLKKGHGFAVNNHGLRSGIAIFIDFNHLRINIHKITAGCSVIIMKRGMFLHVCALKTRGELK